MKKISINTIILFPTLFILILLSIESVSDLINPESLFSFIFPFIFFNLMPIILGFFSAYLFITHLSEKKLNYTLYLIFSFILLLFIYHLLDRYTCAFKNFYGYYDFADFMYHFKYKGNIPFVSTIIDTFTFFLFATLSWIYFGAGFIFNIYLTLTNQHKNKKESKKINSL